MQEADYGMTEQAMREQDRNRGDEHLYVQFFMYPLQDKAKTLEEGRPIFVDTEFVKIMVPGDKENIVTREVRESDKNRFPKQYLAFKNQEKELMEGTPLGKWSYVTAAQVEELKYFGILTVEQLANVSDGNAQKFMGINLLKRRAQEYLDASAEEAPVVQLQDELAKRDSQIEEQQSVIADLQTRLSKLEESEDEDED